MDSSYDIAIVGAGLAGAFAAFHLSDKYRVVVLEKAAVASGASGAGAGLVNPFMARKANPVWQSSEALDALESTLAEAGCAHLFRKTGILRPASDERQAGWFKESEAAHPDSCSWMEAEAVRSRWPAVSAQFGGLFIHRAGRLRLSSLVEALLAASSRRACEIRAATPVIDFRESSSGVTVVTESGTVRTRTLLLCTGADFTDFEDVEAWPSPSARLRAALSGLALHPLKGQTITVTRPESLRTDLPCLAGSGYVVPYPDQLVLGSTYHHAFDDRNPTDADTREILEKTNRMLPGIGDAEVLSADAGVRMTVPGTRLPLVGPVAGSNRVWVFTGLGSKGLLMGALVGRSLPDYLNDPTLIPEKLKVR